MLFTEDELQADNCVRVSANVVTNKFNAKLFDYFCFHLLSLTFKTEVMTKVIVRQ